MSKAALWPPLGTPEPESVLLKGQSVLYKEQSGCSTLCSWQGYIGTSWECRKNLSPVAQPSYWSLTSLSSKRTPQPEPQLLLTSVCGAFMPVPAMSRCAQGTSLTKRCRNCAAVIDPPWRPPTFFMSANFESISLSYSGPSGMRQTFSPVAWPTAVNRAANSSLLENSPAYSCASATRIAPVRVARSIMNFGLKRSCAYQSKSANTSRPSASVLMISTV